ncbi:hypothetical protein Tco_0230298 [Tanacetum coccineum]
MKNLSRKANELRDKRSAKKSSTTPAAGIVFKETPVKTKSTGKEKMDVSRRKDIDLGSGTVSEKPLSFEKITHTVTSEGTGDKPGVPNVTEDDSTESESESWGNDEDNSNNEQEANDDNQEEEEVDQENKYEDDEIESDEDKGMNDTTD